MKPILVNNDQEWIRLAPVLEKQSEYFAGGRKPTLLHPFTYMWYNGGAIVVYKEEGMICFKNYNKSEDIEIQSVDDYLLTKQLTNHLTLGLQEMKNQFTTSEFTDLLKNTLIS